MHLRVGTPRSGHGAWWPWGDVCRPRSAGDRANQLAHLILDFVRPEYRLLDLQPQDRAEPSPKAMDRHLDGTLGQLQFGRDSPVRRELTGIGQVRQERVSLDTLAGEITFLA